MLKTIQQLRSEYQNYANPDDKISRLVKQGKLFRLTKGWYETSADTESVSLISVFSAPCYLSFESALSWHGLIPERVCVQTCASPSRKSRLFSCKFGTYQYRYIPPAAFPYGLEWNTDFDAPFFLATPEKALCDRIYKEKRLNRMDEMEQLLFMDLRVEEEDFMKLDLRRFETLCPLYRTKNLELLLKAARKWIRS